MSVTEKRDKGLEYEDMRRGQAEELTKVLGKKVKWSSWSSEFGTHFYFDLRVGFLKNLLYYVDYEMDRDPEIYVNTASLMDWAHRFADALIRVGVAKRIEIIRNF